MYLYVVINDDVYLHLRLHLNSINLDKLLFHNHNLLEHSIYYNYKIEI